MILNHCGALMEVSPKFTHEIGSYCGKSAVYIGLAAKENDEKLSGKGLEVQPEAKFFR